MPDTAKKIVGLGHTVVVQSGAGASASAPDEQFKAVGAEIAAYGGIGSAERDDARIAHFRRLADEHHLDERRGEDGGEAGRDDEVVRLRQHHLVAGAGKGRERRDGFLARVAGRGEGNDVAREAEGERTAFGEMGLCGGQGAPDRAVEDVGHGGLREYHLFIAGV